MIFITGAARSGTSLVTGILARHGLKLGPVNGLNENLDVREHIVKPYLHSIGADPLCQRPLPYLEDIRPVDNWREKVTRAIGQDEPWGYKGAKMCLIWPLWVEHFPDAKWVIVRRDRESLIGSLLRTSFMQAYSDAVGWGKWVDIHLQRIEELKANAQCIEVWPRDVIAYPETFAPVAQFCGFEFDSAHVYAEINPELYRVA